MYNVTLIHLAPDATSAATEWETVEQSGLGQEEMRQLLENFNASDPVENAAADPEIRVAVRNERYFIRHGQKNLLLYDALNREIPGQIFSVDEVMAELDGTAIAARTQVPFLFAESDLPDEPAVLAAPPQPPANPARLAAMIAIIVTLSGALVWLRWPIGTDAAGNFTRLNAGEIADLQATAAGVYMTGNQPGDHGIALTTTGELRLFELRGSEPPGVVNPSFEWGRVGSSIGLSTDQPGGVIVQSDRDTLVYCGETYERIP
jgi:hypothetical protein